jgi:hypothetical protein
MMAMSCKVTHGMVAQLNTVERCRQTDRGKPYAQQPRQGIIVLLLML